MGKLQFGELQLGELQLGELQLGELQLDELCFLEVNNRLIMLILMDAQVLVTGAYVLHS